MPIYFPKHEATFIHIPKTGGTSFYEWVYENISDYEEPEEPSVWTKEFPSSHSYIIGSVSGAKTIWPNLGQILTFVRNPYSRLVSMYFYQYNSAKKEIKNPRNAKHCIHMARSIALFSKGFDYWIESVCLNSPEFYIIGDTNPKQMNCNSWFNGITPNIVCKLENIQKDFKQIQELFDCNIPLPHKNITNHKPYREYYNEYTKKLVGEMFKEDLDAFNYDF